ncbi:hypothetical protein AVEN_144353-1 [Araneus ventricosus]|uniref:DUF4817 domain-containing protein n=1 Tax=Araneus ventricosus TaxID=182803 RepID=A0A4Y2DKF7_ARAVE|nr:hypothetical protein AVEN_144353-1 [Araneus ventricosus]
MFLSLEQRIFLDLEYQHLEHSCVQSRRTFQRRFHVRRGPSDNVIKALFEKFERTGNVNDDPIGNVCRPSSAITEANADAVQQVMRQQPRTSVRGFAFHAGWTPKNGHGLRRCFFHKYKHAPDSFQLPL